MLGAPAWRPPACTLPLKHTHRPAPPRPQDTVFKLHRWGVRYVVTENAQRHDRPSEHAHYDALHARERGEDVPLPPFDGNVYLKGAVTRIFTAGRFDVFRVA